MANPTGESETSLESERLKEEYLARLARLLRRASPAIRADALREVQTHIEDEWRALGGGSAGLRIVLQRLGPPEEYGRDLALQLILLQGGGRPSPKRLALAAIFWASTSLIGALVVMAAALNLAFALGMLVTAVLRALGTPMMLIQARDYQVFNYHAEQWSFPPLTWSPLVIGLVGLLPAVLIFAGLVRFLSVWMRSRLAQVGLAQVTADRSPALPPGWERRSLLAMLVFAMLGQGGCLLFTLLGGGIPIGQPGTLSLPDDLFREPGMALALLSGLVFLVSPVLGLLWAVKNISTKPDPGR